MLAPGALHVLRRRDLQPPPDGAASVRRIDHIVDNHVLTLFSDDDYQAAFVAAGLDVETVPSPMPGRDRYIGQAPPA